MRDSTGGTGLPLRKTCTYDIIYLEGYDHTTYNSVMYLLGLRVGKRLAEMLEEKELASTIQLAFDYGRAKIDRTLWDEREGFYHAWWDHEKGSPDWLMADSLYGQVRYAKPTMRTALNFKIVLIWGEAIELLSLQGLVIYSSMA